MSACLAKGSHLGQGFMFPVAFIDGRPVAPLSVSHCLVKAELLFVVIANVSVTSIQCLLLPGLSVESVV